MTFVFVISFHVCDHICYWQVIIVEIDIIYGKSGAIYHMFLLCISAKPTSINPLLI
jgi:hypothetical protein